MWINTHQLCTFGHCSFFTLDLPHVLAVCLQQRAVSTSRCHQHIKTPRRKHWKLKPERLFLVSSSQRKDFHFVLCIPHAFWQMLAKLSCELFFFFFPLQQYFSFSHHHKTGEAPGKLLCVRLSPISAMVTSQELLISVFEVSLFKTGFDLCHHFF